MAENPLFQFQSPDHNSPYERLNEFKHFQHILYPTFNYVIQLWLLDDLRTAYQILSKTQDSVAGNDEYSTAILLGLLALLELQRKEYAKALMLAEEGLTAAQTKSNRWCQGLLLKILAAIESRAGISSNSYQDGQKILNEVQNSRSKAANLLKLGATAHLQGRLFEARRYFEESLALFQVSNDLFGQAEALFRLGRVTESDGLFRGGVLMYQAGWRISHQVASKPSPALLLWGLAQNYLKQGQLEQAKAEFESCLLLGNEIGDKHICLVAGWGLGEIALQTGQYSAASDFFKKGLALAFQTRDKYALVGAIYRWALLAEAQANPTKAITLLKRCNSMYGNLHNKLGVARCRDRLAAITRQPPANPKTRAARPQSSRSRARIPRPFKLSKREIEVLRLVANGMSNQEIAEHLILSNYTVSSYLRAVYRKLGVTSRTAAANAARHNNLI